MPHATPEASRELTVGLSFMVGATMVLPVGDVFAKLLTAHLTPVEVALWRLAAQAAFLCVIAIALRDRLRGPLFAPEVVGAGACLLITLLALITAFAVMPIATAIAIFFVEPLLLTLLSGPLLGERIGPRRYAAVLVGLVGALIVIRPNFALHGATALAPVAAALAFAFYAILIRRTTRICSSLTLQLGATLSAAGLMAVIAAGAAAAGLLQIQIGSAPAWAPFAALAAGATASLSFLALAGAFARVEASLLAPFQYLEIVGATVLGFLVFGEFPDALSWLGTAIIVASGAYVFYRERRAGT